MELNANNNISIFAINAKLNDGDNRNANEGYYFEDGNWKTQQPRRDGVYKGEAQSIVYNTAMRQATTMACVLADILAYRNTRENGDTVSQSYNLMEQHGIGTNYAESEESLEKHAANLAAIFDKEHFIMKGEVTNIKIDSKAVTHDKIADNTIRTINMGNILADNAEDTSEIKANVNGLSIRIYQNDNKGKLQVELNGTGNDRSFTNSDNVKIDRAKEKTYLWGSDLISGKYSPAKYDVNVYTENSIVYSRGLYCETGDVILKNTNSKVEAGYFNAASDKRLKENLFKISEFDEIKDFIENTDLYTFFYKNDTEKNIGLIAQDIEKKTIDGVSLVSTGSNGYLSVKENKLVYILWEYVKHLKKELDGLKQSK